MKLKNKYSKQNIYSNQKFEDQIWYNQQIMIFLNFSQLPERVFFALIFQENTFLETKPNFPLTGKCFPLTNFSNDKQTNESLESCFPETTFQKTNSAKAMFVSWNSLSGKPLSKLSYICLTLGKLVNGKHFSVKEKFGLVSRKVFSWKIWAENTFRKLWKFKNVILFADYIKFGPQTFDCYIYFVLNIYFLISSLKI